MLTGEPILVKGMMAAVEESEEEWLKTKRKEESHQVAAATEIVAAASGECGERMTAATSILDSSFKVYVNFLF